MKSQNPLNIKLFNNYIPTYRFALDWVSPQNTLSWCSLIQVSFRKISFYSGYIVFQLAKDNRGCQEGRKRWLSKFQGQWTHPEEFLSGKPGSFLEHGHMLLKLVVLGWVGNLAVLHLGNLSITTKQTDFNHQCLFVHDMYHYM